MKWARRMIVALLVLWGVSAIGGAVLVFTDATLMQLTTKVVQSVAGLLAYLCGVVFFVKMLRGMRGGKVFVPGIVKWLCLAALLGFCESTAGGLMPSEAYHWDPHLFIQSLFSPGKYVSLIRVLLMALLYRIATEVSEENRLTV